MMRYACILGLVSAALATPAWGFMVEEHLDFGFVTYVNSGYGKWGASNPDGAGDSDIDGVDSDGDGEANWCPRSDIEFPQDAVSNGVFTVPAGFVLDHRYAETLIPYNYPFRIDVSSRGNHSFFFWFDQHGPLAGGSNDVSGTGCIIRYKLVESNNIYSVVITGSERPSTPFGDFNSPFMLFTNVTVGSNGFIDVCIEVDPSRDGRVMTNRATSTFTRCGPNCSLRWRVAGSLWASIRRT